MKTCKKCGVVLTDENWQPCFKKRNIGRCRDCQNKQVADWQARNPDNVRERSRRWAAKNRDKIAAYNLANREKQGNNARVRLSKIKLAVFNKLGGKCCICGISDIRVLQINHRHGGGGKEQLYGMDMYVAILTGERSTDDLDLRCANCNLIYEYECGRRKLPSDPGETPVSPDERSL